MNRLTARQRVRALQIGVGLRLAQDREGANYCFRSAFTGQWEGWEQNHKRNRPGKRIVSQDVDLNFGVREQLLSEARALEQTYPIAKRIKNQYADYCVGRCNIRWNTGNTGHDQLYRDAWKAWMPIADARAIHSFPKLMKLSVSNAFCDGDIFIQLVDSSGYSQINLIEADRVSSGGIYNNDTTDMIGGVGITSGRPSKIRVWERTIYGMFVNPVEIPVAEFRHFYDTTRADAYRGVTGFHAVLNPMRDMKEVDDAERLKTKRNSKLALIAKVITGQAPKVDLTGDDDAPISSEGNKIVVEDVDDAATAYMYPNEDVKVHESTVPSSALAHMEFMVRNIALGSNLPFGVVWNMAGLGKPGVLFELEQASRTFRAVQEQLEARLIRPIAGWWLAKEIKNKRLPFNANWYKFKVGRPPDISIDAGRDSKSGIAENLMALKSATSWYDESGDDFEEETELCYKEAAFHVAMSAKYSIPVSTVRQTTPNGNPNGQGDADKQDQSD